MPDLNRRSFVKTIGTAATLLAATPSEFLSASPAKMNKNPLPRWRGFNLLDFYTSQPLRLPRRNTANLTTEDDFKWMSDWGFDFVRIPVQYPCYVKFDSGGDRSKRITPEEVLDFDEQAVDKIEQLIFLANKHNMHVSLNLHRVPGFCVNSGFYEPYNLWKDEPAQQALYTHWGMWANRLKNVSEKKLSFDLINEPCFREDMNDQFSKKAPLPGELYHKIAKGCLEAILSYNKKRIVVADGNNSGGDVTPELNDLPIGQSCRGYFPGTVSHYRAPWVWKNPDDAPKPIWPGEIEGKSYNRKSFEDFYAPWAALVKKGIGVHCGECGCYRETPHDVFLAWLDDMLSVLTENNIGWAFWNFKGDFGILNSGRKDVVYEDLNGHKLDRKMLMLLQKY